jgi:hypothetical protein
MVRCVVTACGEQLFPPPKTTEITVLNSQNMVNRRRSVQVRTPNRQSHQRSPSDPTVRIFRIPASKNHYIGEITALNSQNMVHRRRSVQVRTPNR